MDFSTLNCVDSHSADSQSEQIFWNKSAHYSRTKCIRSQRSSSSKNLELVQHNPNQEIEATPKSLRF